MVRHVQVDALAAAPLVEVGDRPPLVPPRIGQAAMAGMLVALADVARIRAVVLQQREAAVAMELVQPAEVVRAPGAAQARRVAERRASAPAASPRRSRRRRCATPAASSCRSRCPCCARRRHTSARVPSVAGFSFSRSKPLPKVRITISKPTSAHWSMALRHRPLVGEADVHHQRVLRGPRRDDRDTSAASARPQRSRSVLSNGSTQARNDSKVPPGAISWAGPRSGPMSSRHGVFFS